MHNRFHTGNALPEYVLPLVLLSMAILFTLPGVGQINSWFKSVLSQNTGGQVLNGKLIVNSGKAVLTTVTNVDPLTGIPGLTHDAGISADVSTQAVLPIRLSTPTPLIEVVGVFGGSAAAYENVNKLDAFARQFKQSNPNLYNLLIKLGQQGKTLADKQFRYEETAKNNTDPVLTVDDAKIRDDQRVYFEALFAQVVEFSEVYKSLTEDQQSYMTSLVSNVINNTNKHYNTSIASTSDEVAADSQKIENCGWGINCDDN